MAELDKLEAEAASLRRQVDLAEQQLQHLKQRLEAAEQQASTARYLDGAYTGGLLPWIHETMQALNQDVAAVNRHEDIPSASTARWPLLAEEYKRYGRQLIMPEIGLPGQLKLKNAKVLVVGVGGLGCPAATYLAGAGVGTLGLVDGDNVEVSNLHRQIAHSTDRVEMSKVESALEYIKALNPHVNCISHVTHLTSVSAISMFTEYDIVLDCTDHPTSRYLISDACVLTGKPLISASALKTEGQLIILNNPPLPPGERLGGPCYRCVFPKPPPADGVLSCGEGGILGPVVGVMGVLQALEAIKLITSKPERSFDANAMSDDTSTHAEPPRTTLLLFSAYSSPQFRSVRMRSRRAGCAACSSQATIHTHSLTSGSLDYVAFCGATMPINLIPPELRVSATDFARLPQDGSNVLIDVRDETQYAIAALPGSINVPWTGSNESWLQNAEEKGALNTGASACYVVCRVGNDSQLATKALLDRPDLNISVRDIRGGFESWRNEVDPGWPEY